MPLDVKGAGDAEAHHRRERARRERVDAMENPYQRGHKKGEKGDAHEATLGSDLQARFYRTQHTCQGKANVQPDVSLSATALRSGLPNSNERRVL